MCKSWAGRPCSAHAQYRSKAREFAPMMALVRERWDRRIRRAEQLATEGGPTASLLAFYGRVLRRQKALYDSLDGCRPSGSLQRDLPLLIDGAVALLREVAGHGPDQLASEARTLLETSNSAIAK